METKIQVQMERTVYYTLTYDMAAIAEGLGIPLANIETITPGGPGICVEYRNDQGDLLEDLFYGDSAVEEPDTVEPAPDAISIDDLDFQETLKRLKHPLYKMVVEYKHKEAA